MVDLQASPPPAPDVSPPPPASAISPPPPATPGELDPDAIISARGLTKKYGTLTALDRLDLDVPRGSVFGFIGPNGAGKSTAFSIFASLLVPTSGSVSVCGQNPITEAKKVRRKMGYMPDVMGVYERLRVDEYLEFHAAAYGLPRGEHAELVTGLLELVDLDVKRDAMVDGLSRGMKQRLSLARSLVHDPDLLILDEPASGLDPRARIEFRDLLSELQDMGKTILISSHILVELQQMCSHIAVIEAGQLLTSGAPQDILDRLGGTRRAVVTFVGGETMEYPVADEIEQATLLRRLVSEGRDVAEFTVASHDLEDLFLRITEGIVQ